MKNKTSLSFNYNARNILILLQMKDKCKGLQFFYGHGEVE